MAAINLKLFIFFLYLNLVQDYFVVNAVSATNNTGDNDEDYTFLIKGGYRPATHTLTKYAVSIRFVVKGEERYFGEDHHCGGAIIGASTILTAAHCVFYPMDKIREIKLKYRGGKLHVVAKTTNRLEKTSDTETFQVEKVIAHPDYSVTTVLADICILKLNGAIKIDGKLAEVIPLPTSAIAVGANCTVIGWGSLFYDGPSAADAMYVNLNILPYDKCKVFDTTPITGKLCVGDPDDSELSPSNGDSGGPLICDSKIVGVVSYGNEQEGFPVIFTDVWYYRDWIDKNHCCCNYNARLASIFVLCALILIIQ